MKQYDVIKKTDIINWDNVPLVSVDEQPWFVVPNIGMKAQLMWDEDKLYVHQFADEMNIRAEYTEHLSMVAQDSCMEFFVAPVSGDERYFNIELNPNGAVLMGFGPGTTNRVRLLPRDLSTYFNISTSRTETGWELFYEVPSTFFATFFPGFSFKAGMTMRANFYKCGDKTDHVHYLSWNKMTAEKPNFHRYCDFGMITLK